MPERRHDAVVVGAGIIGAATAYYLAHDGRSVLILEQAFPAAGSTGGGMGHVVALDDSDAQLALAAWSRQLLSELADELPERCELDRCGTLWIAEDDDQLDHARSRLAGYQRFGVTAELLDERALAAAEPALRPGLRGALRVPDDMVVYAPALTRWLLDRAAERGAVLRRSARVERIDAMHTTVHLEDGTVIAGDVVVNATGAHAGALTAQLQIVPRKGHLVVTDRYPGVCTHQLVELGYMRSAHDLGAASVAFNVQPRPNGQLLIGSSRELAGWNPRVDRDVVARMLARAVAFVPALAGMLAIRAWTAFRPATHDHLPFIGLLPGCRSVFVAAGHEGLGITTALGTGRLVADAVAGRTPPIDPAPYLPDRSSAFMAAAE